MSRAVFLDRDGVLIRNRDDYVKSPQEVEFLSGALDSVRRLARTPFRIVLVTNQSAVGRGIITLEEAQRISEVVVEALTSAGGRVDAVYMCPHHPEEGCACRKPAPGMLLRASRELGIDLRGSYIVGDAVEDVRAGLRAGVRPVMVLTGRGASHRSLLTPEERRATLMVRDVSEAVDRILQEAVGG